jgi:hypothetical protein
MAKKPTQYESKESQAEQKPPKRERPPISTNLVELRFGLFINTDHIVSVRVLPEEEGNAYAVMQLSSGDKLSLTRDEFSAVCGVEPRSPVRFLPGRSGKKAS